MKSISRGSHRLLLWVWSLVFQGRRAALELKDLPILPSCLCAEALATRGTKIWNLRMKDGKASIASVLFSMYRFQFILGMLCSVLHGVLSALARPLLLRRLIKTADNVALVDVVLLTLVYFSEALLQVWYKQLLLDEFGAAIVAVPTALLAKNIIQKQAPTPLDLGDAEAKKGKVEASETQLVGNDIVRTLENSRMLMHIFSALTQLVCGLSVLFLLLGASAAIGVVVAFFGVFLNGSLSRYNKRNDKRGLEVADKRIAVLRQVLDGIRYIKMCVWEDSYLELASRLRAEESVHNRRFRTFEMMTATIGRTSPIVAGMASFVSMFLMGDPLVASDIFAAVSVWQTLRLPFAVLPQIIIKRISINLSFSRINTALWRPAIAPQPEPTRKELAVQLRNVDLSWNPQCSPVLSSISLEIAWGKMVAVVGGVASGKTTLLTGFLGGIPAINGVAMRVGSGVAYVPQRPITFSGTLLSNILMGHPEEENRLKFALEAAQLMRDLEILPQGLATEIGERGVTLSGGQQTRVNLARAFYHQPRLLIADDPLAAVDVHVASAMFESFKGWQKAASSQQEEGATHECTRSVIMATNQLHLIRDFDHIVYLEAGLVAVQGTPAEVEAQTKSHTKLAEMLESARSAMTYDAAQFEEKKDAQDIDVSDNAPKVGNNGQQQCKPIENGTLKSGPKASTLIPPTFGNKSGDVENKNKLVKAEHRERGSISKSVQTQYLRAIGKGWCTLYFLLLVACYSCMAANDLWLVAWVQDTGEDEDHSGVLIYALLAISHAILMALTNTAGAFGGAAASKHLHRQCLLRMFQAPLSWFEETPSGRTLSRLSADMAKVDLQLPAILDHTFQMTAASSVLFIVVCIVMPPLIVMVILLVPLFVKLDLLVNSSSREVKRMGNNALSPILTLLQESIHGRLLLRVTAQDDWLQKQMLVYCHEYVRASFVSDSLMTFLRFQGNLLGAVFSVALCFLVWGFPEIAENAPGGTASIGLALAYSFVIPYMLSFLSLFRSMATMFFASLERLLELKSDRVPQEKPSRLPDDPASDWPPTGEVEIRSAVMCYRPGLPAAVNGLNLKIQAGERLGIVGRTGAGKSSISVLLLRLVELTDGAVFIDGTNVALIGLHKLRRAISLIPQDPFLFEGTLLRNLDPFGRYSRTQLENAIKMVGLAFSLETEVGPGGSQLSSGQRQLVALARATLSTAKIVLMDEPTASCDAQTDAELQQVVSKVFAGKTLLCIAHRLNTILGYDKILVMDAGKAAEMAAPSELLADSNSVLAQMVARMGASETTSSK